MEFIGTIVAVSVAVTTASAFIVSLMIQAAINSSFEKLRGWINGSFMRSSEVSLRLDGLTKRIEWLEKK